MAHQASTLVPLALAGGQGKSTVALMLGRMLAKSNIPVLYVDADPQASLTAFLGVTLSERPTLHEVLTKSPEKVPLYTAIHEVPDEPNLFIIPATNELENANHSLAASPMSISVLKNRLYQVGEAINPGEKVAENFGIIIVDPPPERSHLALTALGCGNFWVIPAEANIKGVQSLQRTKELLQTCRTVVPDGELLGVIPFRAQWVGLNPTKTTKESIDVMTSLVGPELMLPHILESDTFKKAINQQTLPSSLGKIDLEYPLKVVIKKLLPTLEEYKNNIINTIL